MAALGPDSQTGTAVKRVNTEFPTVATKLY